MEKKVSIIIPVYNEEQDISFTINEIREGLYNSEFTYEIIVVDDGSNNKVILPINKDVDMTLIRHDQNKGYGATIKTGIRGSKFDIVAITDADGTYPNKDLSKLLKDIDKYDMVVGARRGKNVKIPFLRRPAKYFISKLANYLSEMNIPDINSGLRVFKKDIAQKFFYILPSGFSFTTTLTLAMLCNNHHVQYIPIDYYKRTGRSKIRPIQDTFNFIIMIIRAILYFKPLRVFIPISLSLFCLGLLSLTYDIFFLKNLADKTVFLFLSSIQIAMLGMLADIMDKRLNN